MGWTTVYLIIAIVVGFLGIWNLARQRNVFLSLTGILWFLVVLFSYYVSSVYKYHIVAGLPELGELLTYVLIPVFLVLAYFTGNRR